MYFKSKSVMRQIINTSIKLFNLTQRYKTDDYAEMSDLI